MSNKPTSEKIRSLAVNKIRPTAIWHLLYRYSDDVYKLETSNAEMLAILKCALSSFDGRGRTCHKMKTAIRHAEEIN